MVQTLCLSFFAWSQLFHTPLSSAEVTEVDVSAYGARAQWHLFAGRPDPLQELLLLDGSDNDPAVLEGEGVCEGVSG